MSEEEYKALVAQLEADLLKLYESPILNFEQLRVILKYRSVAAIKQSISRGTFPIRVFELPNRTGKFALNSDVAKFLADQIISQGKSHYE